MLTSLNPEAIPAQDRAQPPCPHFGPCGGCQLQHLTYPAQLALKAARLRTLLDATSLALPELQLHASPPLAYRNRIRLTLAEVAGQLRAGYLTSPGADAPEPLPTSIYEGVISTYEGVISTGGGASAAAVERPPHSARATNERPTFLPITECPIAAPILWRATEAVLTLINGNPNTWLRNPNQIPDQLELFTTADESKLQLTLYLRTAAKSLPAKLTAAFTALCEALHADIPALTGAAIALLPIASSQRGRRTEQPRPGPTWGSPGMNYHVTTENEIVTKDGIATKDGIVILSAAKNPRISPLPLPVLQPATYWVPRGAFFQINRFLLPELLGLTTTNRTGDLAFDLYAGVGLFSRVLATCFGQVTAVEAAEPAATTLASTKLPNLRAIKASTLDFLRAAVIQRDRPDLIIFDPPRTGAGPEVCALLARIAAPTLVYVSCSPETLPSDLTTLAASGYRVAELHLFDLFPQTTHIETVAILTR